eukprot:3317141-Karenia_brevis.AAC.1
MDADKMWMETKSFTGHGSLRCSPQLVALQQVLVSTTWHAQHPSCQRKSTEFTCPHLHTRQAS